MRLYPAVSSIQRSMSRTSCFSRLNRCGHGFDSDAKALHHRYFGLARIYCMFSNERWLPVGYFSGLCEPTISDLDGDRGTSWRTHGRICR